MLINDWQTDINALTVELLYFYKCFTNFVVRLYVQKILLYIVICMQLQSINNKTLASTIHIPITVKCMLTSSELYSYSLAKVCILVQMDIHEVIDPESLNSILCHFFPSQQKTEVAVLSQTSLY